MKGVLRSAQQVLAAVGGRSAGSPCRQCDPLQREYQALEREMETLRKQAEAQVEENARLRESLSEADRAGKRQAAPFSRGAPKGAPRPPGRKAGRDYGMKARRAIPDHIDEQFLAPVDPCCPDCGSDDIEKRVVEQYEEDIPEVKPRVRLFLIEVGRCRDCGQRTQGRHPLQTSDAIGAACVHLGPRAKALAADLNKRIGMSFGKVQAVLRVGFGLSVSRGGLSQIVARCAKVLAPTDAALVEQIRTAKLVAADETGWKVGGRLQWLWVFVSSRVTVYRIMAGRSYLEACSVLGAGFCGTLLRDGWAPYRRFRQATHQTCIGGHLIRRCHRILLTAKRGAARFPHAVLRLLQRALRLRDHWLEQPPTPRGRAIHVGRLAAAMDRLLAWQPTDNENRKLVKHLRNERDALFTFLLDPTVPASNWWGEQAIRPAVITRKIWGGNRTAAGAVTQQVIITFFRTAAQQGVDPYPLLAVLLRCPQPRLAALPCMASGP